MFRETIDALQRQPGAHDWVAHHRRKTSTQLYIIGPRPESKRQVQSEQVVVTLYNDHRGRESDSLCRGEAQVTVLTGDLPALAPKLEQAVFMASLTDNPPYGLPGPAVYPEVDLVDASLSERPAEVADNLVSQLVAALAKETDVRLSSAEVIIDETMTSMENSRDAKGKQHASQILFDLVLLATGRDDEMESGASYTRRRASELDVPAIVHRYAQFARDSLVAQPPHTGTFPVVVSDEALAELLLSEGYSPLAYRSSAEYKYQRMSSWEPGKSIFPHAGHGDPLTIYSNSVQPFGTRSTRFDQDGLPAQRTLLVDQGTCAQFWAPQRYAEYLGVAPTGGFGNMEVVTGSASVDQMLAGDGPIYHIVAFSAMSPDPFTGDFVGEIRLGYELDHGTSRPVRGGSISGNLFDVLANAQLSKQAAALGNYFGPRAMRFPQVTVAGD
jgi:predicted Zn-dependent protease